MPNWIHRYGIVVFTIILSAMNPNTITLHVMWLLILSVGMRIVSTPDHIPPDEQSGGRESVFRRKSVALTTDQRHNRNHTYLIRQSNLMPSEKTDQPEGQHVQAKNSWLRRRSVWAGIGVIILLLIVGIILTNNQQTGVSPE